MKDGTFWTWGSNYYGQLGLGDKSDRTIPTKNSLNNIIKIICGIGCTFAISKKYECYSWGKNNRRLGIFMEQNQSIPRKIGLNGVLTISCGEFHTCALTINGNVYTWGDNRHGQLGIGNGISERKNYINLPQKINTLFDIISIQAGIAHTIALTINGKVWVWGSNMHSQLGLISYNVIPVPMELRFNEPIISISCGYQHSIAITSNGKIYGWGNNFNKQLSDT